MAACAWSQATTKVIVRNLPDTWTKDHLQNYLEVTSGDRLQVEAIHLFLDVVYTALVSLEEAVTGETVVDVQEELLDGPFEDEHMLELEAIADCTSTVLVRVFDVSATFDHLSSYFCSLQLPGEVLHCDMRYEDLGFAVVRLSLPEAAKEVLAQGEHRDQEGNRFTVEPWYDLFHGDLLKLLQQRLSKGSPASSQSDKDALDQTHHDTQTDSGKDRAPEDGDTEQDTNSEKLPVTAPEHGDTEQDTKSGKLPVTAPEHGDTEQDTKSEKLPVTASQKEQPIYEEITPFENRKVEVRLAVPFYQWRLLNRGDVQSCAACDLRYLEHEEEVVFSGTDEPCEDAKLHLLRLKQNLQEGELPFPEPVMKLLGTEMGSRRFQALVERHPKCSVKVDQSSIRCAALLEEGRDNLELFKLDVMGALRFKRVKICPDLTSRPLFRAFQFRLERDFMVVVSLKKEDPEHLYLHGFADHMGLVTSELDTFINAYQQSRETFTVPGRLESGAFRKWFSQELDQVKGVIFKNGGDITSESTDGHYTMTYRCPGKVLKEVRSKLDGLKDSIMTETIDMCKMFSSLSERLLIINGLWEVGRETFCSQLDPKLKQRGVKCVLDITLPRRCPLPPFRPGLARGQTGSLPSRRPPAPQAGSSVSASARRGYSVCGSIQHASSRPSLPHRVTVRKVRVTLLMGDITTQQVEAAMCIVGADLKLERTAVGSAFLRKCPALNDVLRNESGAAMSSHRNQECRLTMTHVSMSISTIFHAVLTTLRTPGDVKQTVEKLVFQSLWESEINHVTSIAFPPLGVGRRFGFDGLTTATAMMSAIRNYVVKHKPKHLRTINIVVHHTDSELAGKFTDAMTLVFPESRSRMARRRALKTARLVGRAIARGAVFLSRTIHSKMRVGHASARAERRWRTIVRFEATACVTQIQDFRKARDVLIEELRAAFLWHDVLREHKAMGFLSLPPEAVQEMALLAVQNNVLLSASEGAIELRGQKPRVQEVLLRINDSVLHHGLPAAGSAGARGQRRREKLGLPVDTDRLPTYWRVCQKNPTITYDEAIDSWMERGTRLNSVSAETQDAVEKLVHSTWHITKVGKGADARFLGHTDIKVMGVERLENPKLWQTYSQKREKTFDTLAYHHDGRYAVACRPLETFADSSGPVQTTASIDANSSLSQDIYQEVNEHYLFHGTREDVLSRIFSQGLDDRVCTNAMLGKGVYTAESSTKADQYADPSRHNRTTQGTKLKMLLVRVLLGEPYLYTDANPQPFQRPPCLTCRRRGTECTCRESRLHDSVVFDCDSKLFREFVVYDHEVCYPEYVITYVRV